MKLNVREFQYDLPAEKIASFPLEERDQSKLLVFRDGRIGHTVFYNLVNYLPADCFLFFNNTKVIPARLHFKKSTGADIEIFLLNPVAPSSLLVEAMQARGRSSWNCAIGNLKRWKEGMILSATHNGITLEAALDDRDPALVGFSWSPPHTFAEVIDYFGETPLPPYLKREAKKEDRRTYQTIYSQHEGAVAAPTAGLHFTEKIFSDLRDKNIGHDFLTLHVSAGTFLPIKSEDADKHAMHEEQIIVSYKNVENLLRADRSIIAVGTTSMRTLESIYWYGVKLIRNKNEYFRITQDDPYILPHGYSLTQAIGAVMDHMHEAKTSSLIGKTSIYIKPGYKFRICKGLITNFHQPASTLLVLVAALIGDHWKRVYREALENDYRFLSYGDSSLLLP